MGRFTVDKELILRNDKLFTENQNLKDLLQEAFYTVDDDYLKEQILNALFDKTKKETK